MVRTTEHPPSELAAETLGDADEDPGAACLQELERRLRRAAQVASMLLVSGVGFAIILLPLSASWSGPPAQGGLAALVRVLCIVGQLLSLGLWAVLFYFDSLRRLARALVASLAVASEGRAGSQRAALAVLRVMAAQDLYVLPGTVGVVVYFLIGLGVLVLSTLVWLRTL
jgi:hypothetical protein